MKISPLTNILNPKRAVNQVQKQNIPNTLSSDIFVKSIDNTQVPSVVCLKDIYPKLKEEMTEYIMNTSELSLDKIREITQTHCPGINVDDIKNAPNGTNISFATDAYIYEPVCYGNRDGKLSVLELPKTVYINLTNCDYKNDKNQRIVFLGVVLHELTHVLQSVSDDKKSLFKFSQDFCIQRKSIDDALPTLKAFNPVYNSTELYMLKALSTAVPSIGKLPKEINKRIDVDSLFMKKFKMNSYSFAKNLLDASLKRVVANGQNIDKNAVLEYTIIKSEHEIEAYQNSLDSNKEQLGITSKTDFDLRIEMYDSIIRAAKSLKD